MPSYNSVEELRQALELRRPWYKKIYLWIRWNIINPISDIPFYVKRFYQRGKRGWAVADTWDYDSFLLNILPEILDYKIKHDIRDDKEFFEDLHDMRNTLLSIKHGYFEIKKTQESYDNMQKQIDFVFRVFAKRFTQLWD